jgi:hypothetical protein
VYRVLLENAYGYSAHGRIASIREGNIATNLTEMKWRDIGWFYVA